MTSKRNTVWASVDKVADEETQTKQHEYISILQHHVLGISIASNVNMRERALEDCDNPVYRWCYLPPSKVFVEGFNAHEKGDTPIEQYCDYKLHMMYGPPPLSRGQPSFSRAFMSISANLYWIPKPSERVQNVYCYKIFAPGDISATNTLKNDYKYEPIEKISFVGSILPCYIHSAQHFEQNRRSSPHNIRDYMERVVVNEVYYVNSCYFPSPYLICGDIHQVHNYMSSDLKHIVLYSLSVPM